VVDVTVVQRKLSQLDTYLQQVSEFSTITLEEYQGEWKIQRIVERTLQMMIETCVDITNHLISDRGMRSPTSYADSRCRDCAFRKRFSIVPIVVFSV
jgi:uncharacterized protein YutE (UPF0331/DUF86 family)